MDRIWIQADHLRTDGFRVVWRLATRPSASRAFFQPLARALLFDRPHTADAACGPMLRITVSDTASGQVTRVEGRLVGRWADELTANCTSTLDLEGVTFVDRHGKSVLTTLARQGVRFVNTPPFIAALLERGSE